jgi:hypothetical protein
MKMTLKLSLKRSPEKKLPMVADDDAGSFGDSFILL